MNRVREEETSDIHGIRAAEINITSESSNWSHVMTEPTE